MSSCGYSNNDEIEGMNMADDSNIMVQVREVEYPVMCPKVGELSLFAFILLLKILMILIVSYVLWPKIMPKIFKNINPNPGFVNLFGFSVIISLLM
jgi:hypothetical protein